MTTASPRFVKALPVETAAFFGDAGADTLADFEDRRGARGSARECKAAEAISSFRLRACRVGPGAAFDLQTAAARARVPPVSMKGLGAGPLPAAISSIDR